MKLLLRLNLLALITIGFMGILMLPKSESQKSIELIKNVGSEVVMLVKETNQGTGFHVQAKSGKTYILTNAHVCSPAKVGDVIGVLYEDDSLSSHEVLDIHESHDLCLVEAHKEGGLKIAKKEPTRHSTHNAVGHPLGKLLQSTKGTYLGDTVISMTDGFNLEPNECRGELEEAPIIMQALYGVYNRCVVDFTTSNYNMVVHPGNSGSPVVNEYNELVGVVFALDNRMFNSTEVVPYIVVKEYLERF